MKRKAGYIYNRPMQSSNLHCLVAGHLLKGQEEVLHHLGLLHVLRFEVAHDGLEEGLGRVALAPQAVVLLVLAQRRRAQLPQIRVGLFIKVEPG